MVSLDVARGKGNEGMSTINDRDADRETGRAVYEGRVLPLATCEHIGAAFVSLDALAFALREAFGTDSAGFPDSALEEMGGLVAALRNAGTAELRLSARAQAREAELIERAEVAESRAAAITRECESVRRLKVAAENKARDCDTRVAAYRQQRDEQGARAAALEDELREARESLATWHREALAAQSSLAARTASLDRLMKELGGLTLSQLPGGAYGGALADAYCDIKAGR